MFRIIADSVNLLLTTVEASEMKLFIEMMGEQEFLSVSPIKHLISIVTGLISIVDGCVLRLEVTSVWDLSRA